MIQRNTCLSIGALFALLLTPVQGTMLFVTDIDAGTVSSVDGAGVVTPLVTGLTNPNGIVERGGVLYVASATNGGEIRKYSADNGTDLGLFAAFTGVSGIAMDLLGNVFAFSNTTTVSGSESELRKYDSSGAQQGAAVTGLVESTAIALNDTGEVFLSTSVDHTEYRIRRYSSSLAPIMDWTDLVLNNPLGLIFHGSSLLVSALYDGTVYSFNPDGTNQTVFANTNLDFPWGLAFDPATGNLFVASSLDGSIQRFDGTTGLHIDQIAAGFTTPAGLAFSSVPEPGTYAMIGSALVALSLLGRRKR